MKEAWSPVSAKSIREFWSHVSRTHGKDSCWLWTEKLNDSGYAGMTIEREDGTRQRLDVHRVSWEIENGKAQPKGLLVCHTCDVRHCVRPKHLWLGTHAQNIADAHAKGRVWKGKLGFKKAEEIRKKRADGVSIKTLMVEYGVSRSAIQKVLSGENWSKP
jgi:HNH endonuclease